MLRNFRVYNICKIPSVVLFLYSFNKCYYLRQIKILLQKPNPHKIKYSNSRLPFPTVHVQMSSKKRGRAPAPMRKSDQRSKMADM